MDLSSRLATARDAWPSEKTVPPGLPHALVSAPATAGLPYFFPRESDGWKSREDVKPERGRAPPPIGCSPEYLTVAAALARSFRLRARRRLGRLRPFRHQHLVHPVPIHVHDLEPPAIPGEMLARGRNVTEAVDHEAAERLECSAVLAR